MSRTKGAKDLKPRKGAERPDRTVQTLPGENTKFTAHNLRMFDWETPSFADSEAVRQRVVDYFQICQEDDMKPSVAGLALAFGIDRRRLVEIAQGNLRVSAQKEATPESIGIMKKAYQFLNAQMEDYMQNGKINPVAGIFLMKNSMGYRDQQDVVITPGDNFGEQVSQKELQEKYIDTCRCVEGQFFIGPNDLKLATTLANAGTDHGKFLRQIIVSVDITAPLYWWKEFDTYKVGTVANSCSTMHKIHAREFTLEDFSHEHLYHLALTRLKDIIDDLNTYREFYLESKSKDDWWQMIQLLPSSYNQMRTVQMNYAVLRNMYHARKNHKLDEWHAFCDWIECLPYAQELITGQNLAEKE